MGHARLIKPAVCRVLRNARGGGCPRSIIAPEARREGPFLAHRGSRGIHAAQPLDSRHSPFGPAFGCYFAALRFATIPFGLLMGRLASSVRYRVGKHKRVAVLAANGVFNHKVDKLRVVHPTNTHHRVGWKTAKRFPPWISRPFAARPNTAVPRPCQEAESGHCERTQSRMNVAGFTPLRSCARKAKSFCLKRSWSPAASYLCCARSLAGLAASSFT